MKTISTKFFRFLAGTPALAVAAAAIALTLSATGRAAGTTYYVAPNGNDSASGTLAAPWRTIQHAADAVGPGDTVYVRGGAYQEAVHISSGGTSGNVITFAAYPGETPVLNGGGNDFAGITLEQGASHLKLDGFTFVSYTEVGVALDGGNSYVELANLDSSGGTGGLRMTWGYSGEAPMFGPVDHITLTGSRFHDNSLGGIDCTPGPCSDIVFTNVLVDGNGVGAQTFGADGIAIERGANITLDRVRSIGNGGDGIDLNSRDGAPVAGILIKRSISADNHLNGIKLWSSGRIENSLVYGSGLNPLPLATFDNVTIELVNNTFAYNMRDANYAARDYAMTVGYPESGQPPAGISLVMVNNIFAFNTGPAVGSPTGIYLGAGVTLTGRNNLFYSRGDCEIDAQFTARGCFTQADITDGAWAAETGQGTGDIVADPQFVDPGADNFHPGPGSPALDGGSASGAPALDLDGRPRPLGTGYSIGAYEGTGAAQPSLTWSVNNVYWESYADFLARRLSVDYTLTNSGPGTALGVRVAACTVTSRVRLETPLPLALGDVAPSSSLPVTLVYRVPQGVVSFLAINYLECTDDAGAPLRFPPV